jgi:EAL domain-containing protein (putative c-di-GMP-specific phosphodiesterase class I)
MFESVEAPVLSRCNNVVVFASGEQVQGEASLERSLGKLASSGAIGTYRFHNVNNTDVNDAYFALANIFIFLIDQQQLECAGSRRLAFMALRRSVGGDALVIPVLVQANVRFEESALAFLKPLDMACSDSNAASINNLEAQVREFANKNQVVGDVLPQVSPVAAASQIAEAVDPLPCHMSAYDTFIEQLIGRLQMMRMNDRRRNLNLFSEALLQVLGAEMVYCYLRSKSGDLHLFEADSCQPLHNCPPAAIHSVLEEALEGYSDQLGKRSLHLQNFLPQLVTVNGQEIECMVIVNDRLPNCGVFIAVERGSNKYPLTEILSTIINTLHDALAWARFETYEKLKARVYDSLKRTYRFVSNDMYDDRLRIFNNELKNLGVHFEPMFQFDRVSQRVEIYAYEALAREHADANSAPIEIFNTASLWGMGFQSQLDCTLLDITLTAYSEQLSSAGVVDADLITPLSLNVYPATLRSPKYRELLYKMLNESAVLEGRHLIMEVSEKTVVTPELQSEARKQLEEYRSVVAQLAELTGVRFAIDDFGVGNSTLSRLDSLKPNYVKIDRDILSFDTEMANALIRYLLKSQHERGTSVILEGVDIHSNLSLSEIVNDIGVVLIQGHGLSKAVSRIDPQWEREICQRVRNELGWSVTTPDPVIGATVAPPVVAASDMLH